MKSKAATVTVRLPYMFTDIGLNKCMFSLTLTNFSTFYIHVLDYLEAGGMSGQVVILSCILKILETSSAYIHCSRSLSLLWRPYIWYQ